MNVLVCIPCLLTGGTEIQTLSLVKALVKAGHTVTTVCYFEYARPMVAQYEQAGSRVVCLSDGGRRPHGVWPVSRLLLKGLRRVVRTVRPDVAHVQYMAPGAIPIILLRLLGVSTVVATVHTAADIYRDLRLLHFVQRHVVRAFTCITLRAEQSFFGSSHLYSPELRLQRRNHFTIYNTLPSYITVREQSRVFGSPLTVGVVSRLEVIKGMDMVVPAFAALRSDCRDVRLLVVGDGAARQQMERQAAAAGLGDAVTFMGRQPQSSLQAVYDRIDILLMPSRSEGFGLTALEAMARGCVVVAANVGGLPEVVVDGVSGLLHRPGDVSDLTETVARLVKTPERMRSVSEAAVARARLFSAGSYEQLMADLYQKLKG